MEPRILEYIMVIFDTLKLVMNEWSGKVENQDS